MPFKTKEYLTVTRTLCREVYKTIVITVSEDNYCITFALDTTVAHNCHGKTKSHGTTNLTHGKIMLSDGKTKLTHGSTPLIHGKTKLTHDRTPLIHGKTKLTHGQGRGRTLCDAWHFLCI